MPSSATSPAQAIFLLLVVIAVAFAHVGAASAAMSTTNKRLPGSCLMAASTLCANSDTNAMRCLRKLAVKGDARVPAACAEALMAGVTVKGGRSQEARAKRMSRMLNEGGTCGGGNTCASTSNKRCNDVLNGCSGCPVFTVTTASTLITVTSSTNPSGYRCSNICCAGSTGERHAYCVSATGTAGSGTATTLVYCSSARLSGFA